MAFKRFRKAFKKARSHAVKQGVRKAKALVGLAKQVYQIKKQLNVEKKYWDKSSAITSIIDDATGYFFYPWDGLARGTTPTTRVGDQVKMLYTSVKFTIENVASTSGGGAAHNVRIIAFMDTEPRGDAAMSVATVKSQILQLTSTGALTINSPYNTTQASGQGVVGDRYKILRDFTIQLDNTRVKQKCIKLYFNHGMGKKVKYEDTNSYPTDDRLYVIVLTDSAAANTDLEIKGALSRCCFIDN